MHGLAVKPGMTLQVCHSPPGTSEWNEIEHRMSCHITRNWRGRPLVSHEAIIDPISNTATDQGLTIQAGLDRGSDPTGIEVTDEQLAAVNMTPNAFHGDRNDSIQP